jgi:hypothetical protein
MEKMHHDKNILETAILRDLHYLVSKDLYDHVKYINEHAEINTIELEKFILKSKYKNKCAEYFTNYNKTLC